MRLLSRGPAAAFVLAALMAGTVNPAARAQQKDPDDVTLETCDGLRLNGTWYAGNQNSDTVIMLHAYKSATQSKGEWQSLAKALNTAGFAVLTFDFRGHGKSALAKAMSDKKKFCDVNTYPFNKYCGEPLNPNTIKAIDVKKFLPNYFPFLVNDIAAARRFVDQKNDNRECNSGRLYLIGDRETCSLGML